MQLYSTIELMRQGKHYVMIGYRQDIFALPLGPLLHHAQLALRAVPIATTEVLHLFM